MRKIILEKKQIRLIKEGGTGDVTAAINPSTPSELSQEIGKKFADPRVGSTQVNADATDGNPNNNNMVVDINAKNAQDATTKINKMNNTPNVTKLGKDNVTYNIHKESVMYSKKELNELLKKL